MIDFINKVIASMPNGAVLSGIAIVVEAVLRMIPSQKPLSILYFAEDLLHAFGQLSKSTGDALNQILPQRIAASPVATPAPAAQPAPQA
jgi:hypothetical protein